MSAWHSRQRGRPAMVVSDKGTELNSTAILRWQQESGRLGIASRRTSRCRLACRGLQRAPARRTPERNDVPQHPLSEWRENYKGPTPHELRWAQGERVCKEAHIGSQSERTPPRNDYPPGARATANNCFLTTTDAQEDFSPPQSLRVDLRIG